MSRRRFVQSLALIVILAILDALAFLAVYALMVSGDADFSCAFTCTIGESLGRGLLRLSMLAGGLLGIAAAAVLVAGAVSALGPRRTAPGRRRDRRETGSDGSDAEL